MTNIVRKQQLKESGRKIKPIKDCTLLDDRFMIAVLKDNNEAIQEILRIVLEKPDLVVEQSHVQEVSMNLRGRALVMDVVAKDSLGRLYNIEVQNDAAGAIPKRARYHVALLDAGALQAGEEVKDLPENYVIFLTRDDVLKGNKPIYHIDRVVAETNTLFGECSHIIYVNCAWKLGAKDEELTTPLEKLISDIRCAEPARMHYKTLSEPVESLKSNPEEASVMIDDVYQEGVRDGMAKGREEGREEGRVEGREEGREEGRIEARSDLLKRIQEESLTLEQVKELLAEPSKES